MTLAFYAPMKPPNHPVPSGDRNMARALIAALEFAGADVTLVSTLQTRDGRGAKETQKAMFEAAKREIRRIIPIGRTAEWKAWISYHNYYKAPDLIGPTVAKTLGIPYLQIESTRARKRLDGPWADFAKAAEDAADAAAIIFYFTTHDAAALSRDAPASQIVAHLHPFIAITAKPYAYACGGPILSVGMMRAPDKLSSYRLIAETLTLIHDENWELHIAGDGTARKDVETLMAPFGDQVTFLGLCSQDTLKAAYGNASIFFWPGVNEAFGMAYVEAQAACLPIVAQDRPGVRDVLPAGRYPKPEKGAASLCNMLKILLNAPDTRRQASRASYENATRNHMLPAAAETLKTNLRAVGVLL
jgi:glycosyltransferase involved in cell wall biosynthesis